MCTFCEKIYPEKDCPDIVFHRGKYRYSSMEDEIERFITIDEDGTYDLNVIPDDPYELGFFPDVKFCPYCGRDLAENVEQEPKTGYWIINKDKSLARCSNCKFNLKDKDEIKLLGTFMQGYNYCPYCNTKMVGSQESEEEIGVYENKNIF